jgi:hypothetical protein
MGKDSFVYLTAKIHSLMLTKELEVAITQIETGGLDLAKLALIQANGVVSEYDNIPNCERAQFHAARAFYLMRGGSNLPCTLHKEVATAERLDANNALLRRVKNLRK